MPVRGGLPGGAEGIRTDGHRLDALGSRDWGTFEIVHSFALAPQIGPSQNRGIPVFRHRRRGQKTNRQKAWRSRIDGTAIDYAIFCGRDAALSEFPERRMLRPEHRVLVCLLAIQRRPFDATAPRD
jgi:hypothetical protein